MSEKTIDDLLEVTQNAIWVSGNLEVKDTFEDVSIAMILNDIKLLSENMNDYKGGNNIDAVAILPQYTTAQKQVKLLEKLDNQVRKNVFYEKRIRPILKEKLKYLKDVRFVDGNELLNYDSDAFIFMVYKSVLRREPEKEALKNGLYFLSHTENKKIDFIYEIVHSPEGKKNNIRIKGLKGKKALLTCKRIIYKVPLFGYLVRWSINLALLPRRLRDFQQGFDAVAYQCKLLSLQAHNIEEQHKWLEEQEKLLKAEQDKFEILFEKLAAQTEFIQEEQEKEITLLQTIKEQTVDWQTKEQLLLQRKIMNKKILDDFYVKYNEQLLPDSRENVKQRAQIYIEQLERYFAGSFKNTLCITDLGCGECEWIELLQDNGYIAQGVDSNTQVVKKVRETFPQFKIEENDALSYLKKCKSSSLDVLTSFHMVEHLEVIEIIDLLKECYRVLKKDGVLILETPNPQNILIASYYFHLDPTHKKPLPPELLEFLVKENGFLETEKILLYPLNFIPYEYTEQDPIKDIIFRFNMEQAYAIWAVKK